MSIARQFTYAAGSGIAASLASVFSKLATTPSSGDQTITGPRRVLFISLIFLSNGIMWYLFTKGLSMAPSSVQIIIINNAANMAFSAVAGYYLFQDLAMLKPMWWAGAAVVIFGMFLITKTQPSESTTISSSASDDETRPLREQHDGEDRDDHLGVAVEDSTISRQAEADEVPDPHLE
ncbi:hypothetical protein DFS34DRAFT_695217 [Phlyctochytrium arcticum]|nr:hypothetical protein DFS34DRAFT_695217 [Phlyctochytrium arcticum]